MTLLKQSANRAPTTIAELIALAESDNNSQAIRYEPAFNSDAATIEKCRKANNCNSATAAQLCKMSFGKYQMMAYNLYFYGYSKSVFDFVNSDNDQLQAFTSFLVRRGINFSLNDILTNPAILAKFSRTYNGNAELYSKHLIAVYKNAGGFI